jgi:dihydroxyacid dehydratase/phosphogluconate dehydratase
MADATGLDRLVDDPAVGITEDTVLVLRGAGPLGGPGMPEYGMLPIPAYLLKIGRASCRERVSLHV